jgi:hypothetical protein
MTRCRLLSRSVYRKEQEQEQNTLCETFWLPPGLSLFSVRLDPICGAYIKTHPRSDINTRIYSTLIVQTRSPQFRWRAYTHPPSLCSYTQLIPARRLRCREDADASRLPSSASTRCFPFIETSSAHYLTLLVLLQSSHPVKYILFTLLSGSLLLTHVAGLDLSRSFPPRWFSLLDPTSLFDSPLFHHHG